MEVTSTQATQNAARTAAASEQSNAVLSSDFETFLQMLTAQARYQDPLEPIDSSEYAAQLAQFSMVEQQVLSNDLLQALSAQMSAGSISQIAGWIGMEARTTAPVSFDGSPVTVIPKSEAGADEAVLVAYDADGEEVHRKQIDIGSDPVEWMGIADDGTEFPPGLYSFKVESRVAGQTIGVNSAETYSKITEARRQGAATVFILEGGSAVTAEDVTALREPAEATSDQTA
ncbi:flagellar hook capping FlgD N-terminal domain-containing protein [uncultured Roseobacter sp.]|uniref:flagellar hook capping FlgD N-terminal domain-containing protein n=1 Tax=uncultured Roseobacter sp. TaxID=114847 RepID=UPI0026219F6D|nr:flagellar hook capping FlgD N-terminal domain-containing protein [uncultured Roseobacter sp.]